MCVANHVEDLLDMLQWSVDKTVYGEPSASSNYLVKLMHYMILHKLPMNYIKEILSSNTNKLCFNVYYSWPSTMCFKFYSTGPLESCWWKFWTCFARRLYFLMGILYMFWLYTMLVKRICAQINPNTMQYWKRNKKDQVYQLA